MIDFIARNFQDNHLAGLLIGKYYRAKELGLELIFDPACFVEYQPESDTMIFAGAAGDAALEDPIAQRLVNAASLVGDLNDHMNIMDSITTLIVEDEPMLAEILVDNIKQFPQFDVIGIADKLESARKQLRLV